MMSKEDVATFGKTFRMSVDIKPLLSDIKDRVKQTHTLGDWVEEAIREKWERTSFADELRDLIPDIVAKSIIQNLTESSDAVALREITEFMSSAAAGIREDMLGTEAARENLELQKSMYFIYLVGLRKPMTLDSWDRQILGSLVDRGFLTRTADGTYDLSQRRFALGPEYEV